MRQQWWYGEKLRLIQVQSPSDCILLFFRMSIQAHCSELLCSWPYDSSNNTTSWFLKSPAPSLKNHHFFRKQDAVLGHQTVQSWTCGHCASNGNVEQSDFLSMREVCSSALIDCNLRRGAPHQTRTYSVV